MGVTIQFRSRRLNLEAEPVHPINPIRGWSLLEWLRDRLPTECALTETQAEDWGWYAELRVAGRPYLIGAGADASDDGDPEFSLQIDRPRTLRDRLLRRHRLTVDDPCVRLIHGLLMAEPTVTDLSVDVDR